MAINLANIITAYDALGTLGVATATAYAAIVALGSRPTYPNNVTASTDYNNVTTSQATWDASYTTLSATYNSAVSAQIAQELVVIGLSASNQWFTMTGLANWGANSTQYICVANTKVSNATNEVVVSNSHVKLFKLLSSLTLPTSPAPTV